MRNVSGLEAIHRDYSPRGVQFYYVYKTLAHPETNGYVSPYSLQERLLHVQEARRRLRTQFQWICDTMTNDVKHALGDAPNSEFVIDADGVVVRKRVWSRPAQLRADLEELVGPVEQPTDLEEMDVGFTDDERQVATGVVPRVKPAAATRPLRIEPLESEDDMPYYVKLRAEADDDLLQSGQGEMYLGFHLDTLYGVHWNNQAEPLEFELSLPDGTQVTPAAATAPRVEVAADADPREFLVQVNGAGREPLRLTVRYFACDDAGTFCVPVSQQYAIQWDVDPEGGWVFARGSRPGGRTRGRAADPTASGQPLAMVRRFLTSDRNDDGQITEDELPQPLRSRFELVDGNNDGKIDATELDALAARFGLPREAAAADSPDAVGVPVAEPLTESAEAGREVWETLGRSADPGESQSPPAAATLNGRVSGRLRGLIDGQLKGSFRGELRGELVGAGALTIEGRFEGQIEGRLRGEIDGEFEGVFNGTLGGNP